MQHTRRDWPRLSHIENIKAVDVVKPESVPDPMEAADTKDESTESAAGQDVITPAPDDRPRRRQSIIPLDEDDDAAEGKMDGGPPEEDQIIAQLKDDVVPDNEKSLAASRNSLLPPIVRLGGRPRHAVRGVITVDMGSVGMGNFDRIIILLVQVV